MLCYSGSRGGDLGIITTKRLLQLPNADGILVSQVSGKVASQDNQKHFVLMSSGDLDICPVAHLKEYFRISSDIGVILGDGHLFRVKDNITNTIVDKPVSSSAMSDRLKSHLLAINMYAGESTHSARRGTALVLRMMGVSDDSISEHMGWGSNIMLDHYAKLGGLCGRHGVASTLSRATSAPQSGVSRLHQVSQDVIDIQALQPFSPV